MQYQLRMYTIKRGELDAWVEEWRKHVLPLRRAHGFEVLGPWLDDEDGRFVWIIGHDDFEQANDDYYNSPERKAIDPDPARHIAIVQTRMLSSI